MKKKLGRACIIIRKDINILSLGNLCLQKWRRLMEEEKNILRSVYLPYDSSKPSWTRETEVPVRACREDGSHLIIDSDSNAHQQTWWSFNTNERGEYFLQCIYYNLVISNVDNKPTCINTTRKEVALGSTYVSNYMYSKMECVWLRMFGSQTY